MDFVIVTGATRGLGESIAKLFVEKKMGLITVSRSENPDLKKLSEENDVLYYHFACDLSKTTETERVFNEVGSTVVNEASDRIYFVQNAGAVTPINPSGEVETGELENSIHVNLLSPMVATNVMLKAVKDADQLELIMVNISSGAGSRPVYGWSTYCSTKAGLNMFTETVSLELSKKNSRHKAIAFSPGIMDTDMQGTIRSSSSEAFADVESFQKYKEEGMLRDTDTVAGALIKLVTESEIESGKIYHVNDLL